ncbi:hypothetical protein LRP88_11508 [Fusarium phalaenopsidis]
MARIVSGTDIYGLGSWIDSEALPVPDDARRLLKVLAEATPRFTKDPAILNAVSFTGSPQTIVPGPFKSAVIAGALHAISGIVANELLELRDGQNSNRTVSVDTDHAAFWLGSVGMSKRNGQTVREIARDGKLAAIFPKDLEGDIFATPLKLRATANYESKDEGVWFQLHGSLGADPVLQTIGIDPSQNCSSNDEAYHFIAKHAIESTSINTNGLRRRLNNRHIQLIAIGGTIGTGLFISIGRGLAKGGPGSLLLCYCLYCCLVSLINNSAAEMVTHMPIAGGFIHLAGVWVDEALGFMIGWNFFYEALLIPFEIVALNVIVSFWAPNVVEPGPTAGFCLGVIISYGLLNAVAVGIFGEAEFWLSGGKVILMFMLFSFTFITMVGGNPQGDAYGFRYWSDPGAFASFSSTGAPGRFEGFLQALVTAVFIIVGPDYISMIAAEAKHPSIYLKTAFKTVYLRFGIFFIGSAVAVGIVLPYDDPELRRIYIAGEGSSTAAASPYVIAMTNMGIGVLPHVPCCARAGA